MRVLAVIPMEAAVEIDITQGGGKLEMLWPMLIFVSFCVCGGEDPMMLGVEVDFLPVDLMGRLLCVCVCVSGVCAMFG